MSPTRRGSYGLIETGTLIYLKISPICPVRELAHDIFFKILQQRPKNRDVMNMVHHLKMWQVFLVSTLLSAASNAASTTLLTQCTSHLHPVPTRLLSTSTNPSISHSPEVPKSCHIFHNQTAWYLSSTPPSPLPTQVPSRFQRRISAVSAQPLSSVFLI